MRRSRAGARARKDWGRRGSTLVEAALVLPLLLLLLFAILEFGRLFYTKITVENATRQAGRFAVTGNVKENPEAPGKNLPRQEAIRDYLIEHAPGVSIDRARIVLEPADGGGPGQSVTIRVEHTFEFVTPLIGTLFEGGAFDFRYSTTMKNEPVFTEKTRT